MRVVLVRLESRSKRALVLGLLLLVCAWLAKGVVGSVVAEALADRAAAADGIRRALAWDPKDPYLHLALADALQATERTPDLDRATQEVEAALQLAPTDATIWLRLARLSDAKGDRAGARRALEAGIRYDRHSVSLRWEAALLYLRWGETLRALEHLRYVLEVDPERRDAAFQLARTLLDQGESPTRLLPADTEAQTALLRSAVRDRDVDLAMAVWERRGMREPPLPDDLKRRLVEVLVEEGEGPGARHVWMSMARDDSVSAPGNAVWNGGFETSRLAGWGLDWQVRRTFGVEVRLDPAVAAQGGQSLQLSFKSFPTLDFAGVSQLVPVEPGRAYKLHAVARATDLTTRSGVKLQVVMQDGEQVLGETDAVAGTTEGWVTLEAKVQVPAEVRLVQVRLRRERAQTPEGNLAGKVWIDDVVLAPADGRGA